MQKTGKTLTAHEGTMGVMKETAESNRAALQQQVSANLDETRAIPATIPPLEQFNNWVKKNVGGIAIGTFIGNMNIVGSFKKDGQGVQKF